VIRLYTAVNYELFAPARRNTQNAQRLCVYFGTLSREHNDYDLLRKVSQQFALRLIGLIKDPIHGFSPNTQVVGPVSIDELPAKLSDADVVLLPYKTSRHIESVIPAKTFQCLATGKPIISTGLTKMDWLSEVIYFCKNHEEFLKAIDATRDEPPSLREARLAVAQANSWKSRIDELEEEIREVLLEKGIAR
jgi:glycosyltransferase involved in cell wall biosynthesis